MFEIIPLEFKETEKDNFVADSVFGQFKIWKTTPYQDKGKPVAQWNFRSVDKKTKRFYIDKKDAKDKAEKICQKDYENIFKGLIREN
jgi:hypothetical protein